MNTILEWYFWNTTFYTVWPMSSKFADIVIDTAPQERNHLNYFGMLNWPLRESINTKKWTYHWTVIVPKRSISFKGRFEFERLNIDSCLIVYDSDVWINIHSSFFGGYLFVMYSSYRSINRQFCQYVKWLHIFSSYDSQFWQFWPRNMNTRTENLVYLQ